MQQQSAPQRGLPLKRSPALRGRAQVLASCGAKESEDGEMCLGCMSYLSSFQERLHHLKAADSSEDGLGVETSSLSATQTAVIIINPCV